MRFFSFVIGFCKASAFYLIGLINGLHLEELQQATIFNGAIIINPNFPGVVLVPLCPSGFFCAQSTQLIPSSFLKRESPVCCIYREAQSFSLCHKISTKCPPTISFSGQNGYVVQDFKIFIPGPNCVCLIFGGRTRRRNEC